MIKDKAPQTLFSRLVKTLSWLTFSIVLLFTAATLLITYSFEDVLLNERLKQAHNKLKAGEALPYNIKLIDGSNELEADLFQKIQYFEYGQSKAYGEFDVGKRHFHYLLTEDGTILYDTTDVSIVNRALEDVFLVLAILLIPAILLTLWVAKLSARYALIPFNQLSQLFIDSKKTTNIDESLLEKIKEQDIKEIARELQNALSQKSTLLDQQVMFNQGMAHELKTPLQVMRHSIELLNETHQELSLSPAFIRLENAMDRMQRLSNGLLWLTSEQRFEGCINVKQTIESAIASLQDLAKAHQVTIDFKVEQDFSLQMPKSVLELIVFNLFNNVVNHGKAIGGKIKWLIVVDNNEIRFANLIADNDVIEIQEQHFGIGLTLVSQLTKRFELSNAYVKQRDEFIVVLSI